MKVNEQKFSTFYNEVVIPLRSEHHRTLKTLCEENRDTYAVALVASFTQLIDKTISMQQQNIKGSIAYIALSFFRSNIYTQLTPEFCRFDIYDETAYEDKQECCVYISFPHIKESILDFDKSIREGIKKSSVKLPEYRIEALVLNEVCKFAEVLRYLLRYSIPEIEKLESWQKLNIHDYVDIRFGEFRGNNTYSVYKYDERKADEAIVRRNMLERKPLHYHSVKNADLSQGDYDETDLRFSDFSGSSFEDSSFKNANLIYTSWRNCNLKNVDFSGADLLGADFRGASTDTAIFDNSDVLDVFW